MAPMLSATMRLKRRIWRISAVLISLTLVRDMAPVNIASRNIAHEINRRFLDEVRQNYPGDEACVARMSILNTARSGSAVVQADPARCCCAPEPCRAAPPRNDIHACDERNALAQHLHRLASRRVNGDSLRHAIVGITEN